MKEGKKKKLNQINLNLDGPLRKLYIQLQHLTDIIKFSKVATDCAQEKEFDEYYEFTQFQIASNHVLKFNEAKKIFHLWCLKNSFKDCVENLKLFLDDCHLVCELLAFRKNDQIVGTDFNRIVGPNRKKFHRKGLPKKIIILRDDFSVYSQTEEQVMSLNKVRNCLVHRGGIVQQEDLNTEKELVAKFRELQLIVMSPDKTKSKTINKPVVIEEGHHVGIRTSELEKHFKLGEKIDFSPKEHANTVFTFYIFAVDLYKAISKNLNVNNEDRV